MPLFLARNVACLRVSQDRDHDCRRSHGKSHSSFDASVCRRLSSPKRSQPSQSPATGCPLPADGDAALHARARSADVQGRSVCVVHQRDGVQPHRYTAPDSLGDSAPGDPIPHLAASHRPRRGAWSRSGVAKTVALARVPGARQIPDDSGRGRSGASCAGIGVGLAPQQTERARDPAPFGATGPRLVVAVERERELDVAVRFPSQQRAMSGRDIAARPGRWGDGGAAPEREQG